MLFSVASGDEDRVVRIDPNIPGDQGEGIHCFRLLPNHEKDGVGYTGVQLELDVITRDVELGHYWMEYIEGSDETFLYKPLLAATYVQDKDLHDARQKDPNVIKGHDAARSAYSKISADGRYIKVMVKFPTGFKLTQKPFGVPTGDNEFETAQGELMTYKADTEHKDAAGNKIYTIVARLTWKFCDQSTATTLRVTERGGKKSVADSFAGM